VVVLPQLITSLNLALNASNKPVLTWTPAVGATGYAIKRTVPGQAQVTLSTPNLTGTTWTDTTVAASTTYQYVVIALNDTGAFATSPVQTIIVPAVGTPPAVIKPGQVTGVVLALNTQGKPVITWAETAAATSYRVNRNLVGTTVYEVLATNVTSATYTDVTALPGVRYAYWINAVNSGGTGAGSTWAAITTTALPAQVATLTTALNVDGKPVLTWTAAARATSYAISRAVNGQAAVLLDTPGLT